MNKNFVAEINANVNRFISNINRAQAAANRLQDKVTVDVDADTAAATAQISKFRAMLKSIPNKFRVRSDVDTSANDKIKMFMNTMSRASAKVTEFGKNIGTLPALLGAIAPAAIPVLASIVPAIMAIGNALAVVGGGAIGLAGAFGIAGVGALAFGGMAMRAYQMLQDGTIQATAQTRAFQTALDSLKTQFDNLVSANSGAIFKTMTNGINIAKNALTGLTPFITGVANSMAQLSAKVSNWVQSSTVAQNFFNMMRTTGVSVFENIMTAAGKFGSGLISLFTQFGPLFSWVAQGLANMGSQFDAWSQKVSTSQGIQNFINYTKTNLPLIGQIFGNTFNGIFNLFAAFGTNSQTIFQSLADMSARFAAWSATVSQSQGFKQFIEYVQTQGPVLMSTIGSIITALVAFGTAMAPIGAKVLSLVSAVAQWVTGFATAHPQITAVVGSIMLFGGAIMKAIAFMQPFISVIMEIGSFVIQLVSKFNLVKNVITLVSAAFTLLTSPIGIAIAAVVAIGAAIYLLWTKCEAFRNGVTILGAALMTVGQIIMSALGAALQAVIAWITQVISGIVSFGSQLLSSMTSAWNMVTTAISTALSVAVSFVSSSFSNMLSTASSIMSSILSAASSIFSSIVSAISSAISSAVSFVSSGFSNMLSVASSIMSSILSTISSVWSSITSFISSAISTVISVVSSGFSSMLSTIVSFGSSIVSTITSAMSSFVSAISSGASQALSAITTMVSNILSAVTGAASDMISAGADLVRGFISGIQNMAGEAVKAAGKMASDAVAQVKSFLKIGSPSKVLKQIGAWTSQGMAIGISKAAPLVRKASVKIVNNVVKQFAKIKSASKDKAKDGVKSLYKTLATASETASNKMAKNNKRMISIQKRLRGKLKQSTRNTLNKQLANLKKENRAYAVQKAVVKSMSKSFRSSGNKMINIASMRENLAKRIKSAQDKLKDVIGKRDEFKKAIMDDIRGYASITNTGRKSSNGMIKVMQQRLNAARQYQKNIELLKRRGVNKSTLRDILDAGIESGGDIAKGLVKGGKNAIKRVNSIQAQINAVSSRFANQNANTFYKNGIDVARGLVNGLKSQDKQLAAVAAKMANVLTSTMRKKLGIHSPSRVMIELMQFVGKGLVKGLNTASRMASMAAASVSKGIESNIAPDMRLADIKTAADVKNISGTITQEMINADDTADSQQVINIFMNTDLDVVGLKHEIDRIDGTDAHINVLSQGAY
ncbi:hypothetical protein MKY53_05150 [Macrococcus sp. FSL R5-0951]